MLESEEGSKLLVHDICLNVYGFVLRVLLSNVLENNSIQYYVP